MAKPTSELLQRLTARGYMHQCTDLAALDTLAASNTVVGYIGFDCTAPSLHVGSLLQIMLLRHMQQTGHKPLVVLGGGTTRIGDPSGKDEARQLLDDAAIAANMAGIRQVFEKFLTFGDGPTDAVMINNDDWLRDINYVDFLRDYGRHFSVNRMLGFDSVKLRLEREQPLSFLEFNYMILQAYDFLELHKRYGCALQLGGSDQWGNIINGVDLTRRLAGAEVFGFTSPLITTASGAKMGKTAAGAVWLNPDMLSPYDYWQFWRNTDDADVGRFLRLFTDMPLADIEQLEKLEGAELNEAKKTLATRATAMAHGQQAADQAAETARKTFEEGGLSANLPTVDLPRAALMAGVAAFDLLHQAGLAGSKGEARKLVRGGGARINDARLDDENVLISLSDVNADGVIKLSAGKKRHVLVKPV